MGLLGQMTVRFGGDTSGLSGAVGQAKGILGQLGKNPLAAVGLGFAAVAGAAVGFGIASVKAAGDFQQSMSKVQAYAGLTKQQTDDLGNSILSLATQMGQSPKAMADALYPIISSGYSASQALNILKLSAMTSAASGANMATVADALTTSLKAMHAPASQAGQYMDYINKIVSLGKGEVPQYAAVIGKLALSAGSAHVPFSDMGAALATLTTHGFPSVAQASTSLGNLFTQIGPKVDAVATHAKKLGLTFDENKFKTMDLSDKLGYLKEVTGGNQGELLKLVGGSTVALKAFNALSGSGKDFTDNLKAMKDSTGTTASVFKTTYGDWNNTVARLGATFQVLLITVGQQLLPVLTRIVQNVTPIISQFANWITTSGIIPDIIGLVTNAIGGLITGVQIAIGFIQGIIGVIQTVVGWFIQWHDPIFIVAGVILAFFLPALISAGINALIAGAQVTGGFIASMIQTGLKAVVSAAQVTGSFIASMVTTGAQAWIQGGKVIAGFVGAMLTTAAKAVWSGAQVVGSFVASMLTSAAKAVWSAAQVTGSFIASMVQAGIKAGIAAAQVIGSFVASMITAAGQAIITAGTFLGTLIPAIISFAAEAITAAVVAIPAILAGFVAWIAGALAVAAANIAAFWPVYLVIAVIIAIIALVILAVKNWGAIAHWLQGVWGAISGFFKGLWAGIVGAFQAVVGFFQGAISNIGGAFSGLGKMVKGIWDGIVGAVKGAINLVIGAIDAFIGFIDGIQIHIPSIGFGPVHTPQFDWNGLGIPKIPMLAGGGMIAGSGWAIVGESGPEMVKLPTGSDVYPHGYGPPQSSNNNTQNMRQDIYVQLDSQTIAHVSGNRQARLVRLKMGRRAA